MVTYIKSDLEFILEQIKISEAHVLYLETDGAEGAPLFGESLNANPASIPAYNIAWGLRTVDGTYNHLLPGQETWVGRPGISRAFGAAISHSYCDGRFRWRRAHGSRAGADDLYTGRRCRWTRAERYAR